MNLASTRPTNCTLELKEVNATILDVFSPSPAFLKIFTTFLRVHFQGMFSLATLR